MHGGFSEFFSRTRVTGKGTLLLSPNYSVNPSFRAGGSNHMAVGGFISSLKIKQSESGKHQLRVWGF